MELLAQQTDALGQLLLFPDHNRRVDGKEEEWRPVPGHEGYFVSSFGRFRDRFNRAIRGTKNHNGYIHVAFTQDGKQRWYLAHRIVASAFLPKPETESYLVVNHIDRNRHNNVASNLEWVTVAANTRHWRRR